MGTMTEQYKKSAHLSTRPKRKGNYSFLIMNFFLLLLLPVLSIAGAFILENEPFGWSLTGKWFIFWAVGMRLFLAGIKQSSDPEYTATKIFHMKSTEGFVVIRELGFANISLGVMGILSVINSDWRMIAAITGGLFFGLAGIQHLFKKSDSRNEVIAMVGDLFVFTIMLLYLSFTLIA
jgi:hypothetical protein